MRFKHFGYFIWGGLRIRPEGTDLLARRNDAPKINAVMEQKPIMIDRRGSLYSGSGSVNNSGPGRFGMPIGSFIRPLVCILFVCQHRTVKGHYENHNHQQIQA